MKNLADAPHYLCHAAYVTVTYSQQRTELYIYKMKHDEKYYWVRYSYGVLGGDLKKLILICLCVLCNILFFIISLHQYLGYKYISEIL